MPNFLKVSILFSFIFNLSAAEVDQFTRRDEPLADMAELLNQKANLYFNQAISDLNEKNKGCDEKRLYKELQKYFKNHIKGKFTKYVIESEEVARRHIPFEESVYRDWDNTTGFILGNSLYRKSGGVALSDLVKVGNSVVGTDKFEHLFGRGFSYFTNYYIKNMPIEETMKEGTNQEKYIYGGLFFETGIFSFGDLSANFNGMRLWNHILLKQDDILGNEHNLGPYIKCEENKWVKNLDIDLRNYVDDSMDEGVNCSKFSRKIGLKKFQERTKGSNRCGADSKTSLEGFEAKYKNFSSWIINENGNETVNYNGEYGH
jgi:hypothetical protein